MKKATTVLFILAIVSLAGAIATAAALRFYATGATTAADSFTVNSGAELYGYTVHLSASGTGTATLTLNSAQGAAYDTIISSLDMVTAGTDSVTLFTQPILLGNGDGLDWAWNNSGSDTYGIYLMLKWDR